MRLEHALLGRSAEAQAVVPDADVSGTWTNELQSTVEIAQNGKVLSGRYTSQKSADGKQATGPLSGYVNGNALAFVVGWETHQAVTAWTGIVRADGSIETLWQMASNVDAGNEWEAINAGTDIFTPS